MSWIWWNRRGMAWNSCWRGSRTRRCLSVTADHRFLDAALLPAADRARLAFVAPGRADFLLLRLCPRRASSYACQSARGQPSPLPLPYAPLLYTRVAYGHTLVAVAALNLAQADAATAAPYRAALRTLQARAPDARARFDVYRDAHAVSWVQAPCRPADTEPWFFLRVAPAEPQDLPPDRCRQGFEDLHFPFAERGVRVDDACLVSVALPAYPLRALQVGQRGAQPWQADLFVAPAAARSEYRAAYRALATRAPTHRDVFDVYVGASTVTFAKAPCIAADTEPPFLLRVTPADPAVLPDRPFDDLDFPFFARGARFDDVCLASVPLPAYPVSALQVGQRQTGEGGERGGRPTSSSGRGRNTAPPTAR